MTRFGTVSAWAALAMGALFGVNAYFQFATGVAAWVHVATALGLLVGGFRALRRMPGGLRLLAGAWGFAARLMTMPLVVAQNAPSMWARLSIGELAFLVAALIGLALAVLHKERK
jgi:hypothetical protein